MESDAICIVVVVVYVQDFVDDNCSRRGRRSFKCTEMINGKPTNFKMDTKVGARDKAVH